MLLTKIAHPMFNLHCRLRAASSLNNQDSHPGITTDSSLFDNQAMLNPKKTKATRDSCTSSIQNCNLFSNKNVSSSAVARLEFLKHTVTSSREMIAQRF